MLKKHKYETIKESYESSFKKLTNEELNGLQNHLTFLDKVHSEMIGCEEESNVFKANLKAYLSGDGNEFFALCKNVYIEQQSIEKQRTFLNFLSSQKVETGRDLIPVVKKLSDKTGDNLWGDLKNEIYANEAGDFRVGVLNSLIEGFSFEKVTLYNRFLEAVCLLANYLEGILKSADFSLILNICNKNEKFVFILLYPYFLKPLGKIIWPTLLSHFHFFSGCFTLFMKKVATTCVSGRDFGRVIQNLTVSKTFKFTVGIGSLSGFFLYNNYYLKSNPLALTSPMLYKGLSGPFGAYFTIFRTEGSKIIYELTKTLSVFSNAAIAGAVEPKQEILGKMIESLKRK
jgi:hypothetical protein